MHYSFVACVWIDVSNGPRERKRAAWHKIWCISHIKWSDYHFSTETKIYAFWSSQCPLFFSSYSASPHTHHVFGAINLWNVFFSTPSLRLIYFVLFHRFYFVFVLICVYAFYFRKNKNIITTKNLVIGWFKMNERQWKSYCILFVIFIFIVLVTP